MANVLVVDDEPGIVQLLTLVLKQNGHTVVSATNGVEGLMVYSSYHSNIDLVLADVVMPGMNGVELVARLRMIDPAVKILLMSGAVPAGIEAPEDLRLLRKPFPPQVLLEAVEQMLESAPHGGHS